MGFAARLLGAPGAGFTTKARHWRSKYFRRDNRKSKDCYSNTHVPLLVASVSGLLLRMLEIERITWLQTRTAPTDSGALWVHEIELSAKIGKIEASALVFYQRRRLFTRPSFIHLRLFTQHRHLPIQDMSRLSSIATFISDLHRLAWQRKGRKIPRKRV